MLTTMCPTCKAKFDSKDHSPRKTPCGHIFCHKCVKQFLSKLIPDVCCFCFKDLPLGRLNLCPKVNLSKEEKEAKNESEDPYIRQYPAATRRSRRIKKEDPIEDHSEKSRSRDEQKPRARTMKKAKNSKE
mmetsp:Transcript_9896/g.8431  ORF Transcript_9896/g.8431 Transcript_9896/m.8431 type:complete len:130 (+) Transcript_9896:38-427(+)